MQKRLLFLGASFFQLPPILYAKEQGHYIITCDYLPDNPGHRYAHEYHNVSTTDIEGVLQLAKLRGIDGVVAYGSDPSAVTAAFVSEQLNLPGNPYQSVCILTQKDHYRNFLRENNFNAPLSASFSSLDEAEAYFDVMNQSLMVKPVDSSGSKGVFRVDSKLELQKAFFDAMLFSRSKKIILESYVPRKGYQIAGDGFVVNGKLVFRCFAQEHFVPSGNHFAPVGESYPLLLPETIQAKIHHEIDRLVQLLHLDNGALNFDIILNHQDEVYLMEVGPRGGGNWISEMIRYTTGTNLVEYVIDSALGKDCSRLTMGTTSGYYGFYVLHATRDGMLKHVNIDSSLKYNVIQSKMFVEAGKPVPPYRNSGDTLGCLILKFSGPDEMLEKMESMNEKVFVQVE